MFEAQGQAWKNETSVYQSYIISRSWYTWIYLTIESGKGDKDVKILVIRASLHQVCAQTFITLNQSLQRLQPRPCGTNSLYIMDYLKRFYHTRGEILRVIWYQELSKLIQVKKLRTTAYHPMKNGQCERYNGTLINMMGTLPDKPKSQWPEHFSTLVYMLIIPPRINSMDLSPYFLMYEKETKITLRLVLWNSNSGHLCYSQYKIHAIVVNQTKMWVYKVAQDVSEKESQRCKHNYDWRVKCVKLAPRDLVLVKWQAFKGQHKIQDHWENHVFKVKPHECEGKANHLQ